MLGEFFAAHPEDIDEALVANGPYGRLTTVEAKGLSEVSLATLGEILGVGTYDDLVGRIAERPQAESGEADVLTIPANLRDAFSGEADLDAAASRWVTTDELSLDGWQKEDAFEVLGELSKLARTATTESRELWYWWSL